MLKSKIIFTIVILLIIVMKSSLAYSGNEYKRIPLRWEDVYIIPQKFDIPFAIMITVLHQEDGYVGLKRKNDNGTYDYGPFHINSIHLQSDEFKSAGLNALAAVTI